MASLPYPLSIKDFNLKNIVSLYLQLYLRQLIAQCWAFWVFFQIESLASACGVKSCVACVDQAFNLSRQFLVRLSCRRVTESTCKITLYDAGNCFLLLRCEEFSVFFKSTGVVNIFLSYLNASVCNINSFFIAPFFKQFV